MWINPAKSNEFGMIRERTNGLALRTAGAIAFLGCAFVTVRGLFLRIFRGCTVRGFGCCAGSCRVRSLGGSFGLLFQW